MMICRSKRPSRLRRAMVFLALTAAAGCARPAQVPSATGAAGGGPTDAIAQYTAPTVRQGPFRVTCYKDEAVVFEHGTIFRVYRPNGADAGWSYETGDGLKYRGRIGENVNCVWR